MTTTQKVKVFIIEDEIAFIDGLKLYFQHSDFIEYIGSATTVKECLENTKSKPIGSIDVFLIDIVLNHDRLGGIKLAKKLKERYKWRTDNPALVFLTGNESKEYQNIAKELEASFLDKNLRIPKIMEKLKEIHFSKKEHYEPVKPTVTDLLQSNLRKSLTRTEGKVAVNLGALGSNKTVAKKLLELENQKEKDPKKRKPITEKRIKGRLLTVNKHLTNIYQKLDLEDLIDLINSVREYGLIGKSDNRSMLIDVVKESKLIDHIEEINQFPKKWF